MGTARKRMQGVYSHFRRRGIFWGGGLLLLIAVVSFSSRAATPSGLEVQATGRVDRGTVSQEIFATGVIKPVEGAEVKTGARLTARIEKMHVKLGDRVTKGQIVAELDSRELLMEKEMLQHSLEKLRSELLIVEQSYPLDVENAEALVKIAEADMDYATIILDRYLSLLKSRSVSLVDLDKARQQKNSAANTLATKQIALKKLHVEYALNVKHLKAQIAETESMLQSAQVRLSYAAIHSPMAGVVSEITAREGETLVAGMQVANLITVIDPELLELQIFIDENDIGVVTDGSEVRFTVQAYTNREFSGRVNLIHPAPEIRDNIVYYRALVQIDKNTALSLRPEMTARCRVLADFKENVLRIPNSAFKWIGETQVVFVMDGNRVEPVRVRTGMVGADTTEVLEGIAESAVVATQLTLPAPLPEAWLQAIRQPPVGSRAEVQ